MKILFAIALLLISVHTMRAHTARADLLDVHWSHSDPNSVDYFVFKLGTTEGGDDLGVYDLTAPASEADGTFRAVVDTGNTVLPPITIHGEMVARGPSRTSLPSNIMAYPVPEAPVMLQNGFGLMTLFGIRRRIVNDVQA